MKYNIPEVGELELNTIILDLNGTLAVNGEIVSGVEPRIQKLKSMGYQICLFTGDQRGNAKELCEGLGIEFRIAKTGEEKRNLMKEFDKDKTVAIGNARIDIGTFENSALAIATIQADGIHAKILSHVDIVVTNINDAFDILIDSDKMAATMRM